VLIEGTFQALKRGSILINPVPLRLTFYDPIPADSFEVRDRDMLCGEGPSNTYYLYDSLYEQVLGKTAESCQEADH
jgi:hypothetical protein